MPANGRFLLDTNIIIGLFAGESSVKEHLEEVGEVFIPSIVLGELYFGAWKSRQAERNLAQVNELAIHSAVLACDVGTAQEYGIIKNALGVRGQPIPENDIWIAAMARQYELILVTHDTHFDKIEGLAVVSW